MVGERHEKRKTKTIEERSLDKEHGNVPMEWVQHVNTWYSSPPENIGLKWWSTCIANAKP
jgi:hypothetical protein